MSALARIRVVLVRPRDAGNVGAAARAMKNTGLARLVLVAPPALDHARAAALAVHAHDVLAARTTCESLADAVADCGLVVGTSGRRTAVGAGALTPHALAPEILRVALVSEVALVFGPEDHGLPNHELDLCQRVITIPTSAAYASLNLAQAVLLCGYELLLADALPPAGAARTLAPQERRELLYAKLETALSAIGFLKRDSAEHVMRRLRRMLGRADLDDEEVQILLGLARQIAWAAAQLPRSRSRRPSE